MAISDPFGDDLQPAKFEIRRRIPGPSGCRLCPGDNISVPAGPRFFRSAVRACRKIGRGDHRQAGCVRIYADVFQPEVRRAIVAIFHAAAHPQDSDRQGCMTGPLRMNSKGRNVAKVTIE